MSTVTQAEFARLHGVSRKTVTTWKSRNLLVFEGEGVDVEASNARIKNLRKGALPVTSVVTQEGNGVTHGAEADEVTIKARDDETPAQAAERIALSVAPHGFEEARRIKENYLAFLNQLEYDKQSGAVVAVADVSSTVGASYARVRTKLLAIPAEQAPRLHRLKTIPEVQDALHGMITAALEELTRGSPGAAGG